MGSNAKEWANRKCHQEDIDREVQQRDWEREQLERYDPEFQGPCYADCRFDQEED